MVAFFYYRLFEWFSKKIKKWSKSKNIALINNEVEKLPNLSKKYFG